MATTIDRPGASTTPPPAPPGRRGPGRSRWDAPVGIGLGLLGCVLGLLVLAWAVLFVTKGRFLKHTVERIASKQMQRQVRVAGDFQLYFDPIALKFVADGITVSNPGWASKPNFLAADHVDTRVSTIQAIFGHYHAYWLNLVNAAIDTEWDKDHVHNTWTFGEQGKSSGKPFQMPVIDTASVAGTTLRYRDPKMAVSTDVTFDTVRSTGKHIDDAIRARATGTVRAFPFTATASLLTPNSAISMGRTRIQAAVDAVHAHADIVGDMAGPTTIAGAQLDVAVRGANLRYIFDLAHIAVPDTRPFRLRSHFTKEGDTYHFARLAGGIGGSDIAGYLKIAVPDNRPKLTADLRSRRLDIVDIGPLIGYDPTRIAQGPTAAATTQGTPSGGHPRLLPDAPLRMDAIKTFDAHVNYAVAAIAAPHVPVSNLTMVVDLDHNLLKLSPITMDVAGTGHLSADISLNARVPAVVTDYDIRLSPTPLGRLLTGFGMKDAGTTGTVKARIKMTGTGDSVRKSLATANGRIAIGLPKGTFWTQYAQLSEFDVGVFLQKLLQDKLKQPITINCGLIGFTVHDGIARTDPVLIDTDKNVMTANGGFSFKDESFNMQFRSRAKKFSAFSGQSPVGIGGYFADWHLQIVTPQLVTRGVAAVALGVVATPIASALAFVDLGTTPDTACGPVLSGATAAQQHTEKGGAVKGLGDTSDNTGKAAKPVHKKFLGIF